MSYGLTVPFRVLSDCTHSRDWTAPQNDYRIYHESVATGVMER